MDDFAVDNAVVERLIVEEVEYVLDGARQDVVSSCDAEQCLKQVVDVQLQCALLTTCGIDQSIYLSRNLTDTGADIMGGCNLH